MSKIQVHAAGELNGNPDQQTVTNELPVLSRKHARAIVKADMAQPGGSMLDHKKVQEWTKHLREVARGKAILFHGSPFVSKIVRTNTLLRSNFLVVSFSRAPHVAVHFARLKRLDHDPVPAVFLFDRELLAQRYRLMPVREAPTYQGAWLLKDEFEERIAYRDIANVSSLIHAVSIFHEKPLTLYAEDFGTLRDLVRRMAFHAWIKRREAVKLKFGFS